MIAAWMVYAIAVSGSLALAALAAERALGLYGRPVRFLWLTALLGGFVLPLLTQAGWLVPGGGTVASGSLIARSLPALVVGPEGAYAQLGAWTASLDTLLLGAWVIASTIILASLAASFGRLRRDETAWTHQEVEGFPVLVSPDLGPALIGLLSTAIVVPRWFRDLPPETRKLALLHEREHLRAGDSRLLVLCVVAVALMPWNPAMWWTLRRLRAAVELDCDHRVLRGGVKPRVYASALLDVAERTRPLGLAAPAVTEPKSMLSRRITAMLPTTMRARWPRAAAYGIAAITLLALACEAPPPDRAAQEPTGVQDVTIGLGDVFPEGMPGLEDPERASCPAPQYPRLLLEAGVEGMVRNTFVVGTDGRMEPGSIEILHSTNKAFEEPVRHMIENCVFRPGRLNGEVVRVRVQMPIRFVLRGRGM